MQGIHFEYLKKDEFDLYAPRMFALLSENMSPIDPLTVPYAQAFADWCRALGGAFRNRAEREIVLLVTASGELVGFFGYCADGDTFLMEEIQFVPAWQGKGLFRLLYAFVLQDLPEGLRFTEAYAHKKNARSLAILGKLGLSVIGENKTGSCYRLRGDFDDLVRFFGV